MFDITLACEVKYLGFGHSFESCMFLIKNPSPVCFYKLPTPPCGSFTNSLVHRDISLKEIYQNKFPKFKSSLRFNFEININNCEYCFFSLLFFIRDVVLVLNSRQWRNIYLEMTGYELS